MAESDEDRKRRAAGEATYQQLADDGDAVAIQRDDMRERLDRIRAAAESDPGLSTPLRDFLLNETRPGWLHVTSEMVQRLRTTGSHHEYSQPHGIVGLTSGCGLCSEPDCKGDHDA